MIRRLRFLPGLLLLAAIACGRTGLLDDDDAVVDPDGATLNPGDGPPSAPMGPCNAVVQQRAIEGFTHVPICSPVTYISNPPSSGNHYPIWAAFQTYDFAAAEGYWVHDLEHGAIVFTYNCPAGCDADVAAAQAYIDAMPDDPLCEPDAGDPRVRMTMTPDSNVTTEFAASSWGWTLRADCFDPVTFGAFVQAHYGQGREMLCGQGTTQPVCSD
ncbi:MAG: DUF3105 domain-containing protein [Polyangiaceae bacterium]